MPTPWIAAWPSASPHRRTRRPAEPFGLLADPKVLDKAATYLAQEFARTDAADHETRAALLHALSTRRRATFEQANALNRSRQDLPDVALAYLALTFANL